MKLSSIFKRGLHLLRIGKAVRNLRRATGEEPHQRARNYLVGVLGRSRGIPAKVGQFLCMNQSESGLGETLDSSLPPMPFEQVTEVLREAYQAPHDAVFRTLDREGRPASLGQVHFGELRDGRPIAVKIQYPEIAHAVEAEMTLLGWLPKAGPVSRWGFNLKGYRDSFWDNFSKELNYEHEAENQQQYRGSIAPLGNVVVPETIPSLCRVNVLVQRREDGISLEKAKTFAPGHRQIMGKVLLDHYLYMLFRHGFVHSDPNPGNFAFRQINRRKFDLILYDYGSILKIPEETRLLLLRIILALRDREQIDPVACLEAVGFDAAKLADLRPYLPALLDVLFEPFLVEAPYGMERWRISQRVDGIAGELKWWFRSAAPAGMIFLLRTLHGLVVHLEGLGAKLSWATALDRLCDDQYPQARAIRLAPAASAGGTAPGFNVLARFLKVDVIKTNGNRVKLTMPARVADCLEEVIDPPVKEAIDRQGIDLGAIQNRIRRSGFIPQTVFEVDDLERKVRVWLE